MRKRMWVEVWYEGGAEAHIRFAARGWEWQFPGDVRLIDAVQVLNGLPPRKL